MPWPHTKRLNQKSRLPRSSGNFLRVSMKGSKHDNMIRKISKTVDNSKDHLWIGLKTHKSLKVDLTMIRVFSSFSQHFSFSMSSTSSWIKLWKKAEKSGDLSFPWRKICWGLPRKFKSMQRRTSKRKVYQKKFLVGWTWKIWSEHVLLSSPLRNSGELING